MGVRIPRATTPTFVLALPESIDLGEAHNVYASFRANGAQITKTGAELEIDGNEVSVRLTQTDTLGWFPGQKLEIQLNWVYSDGSRVATEVAQVDITKQLLAEVLS